ncbi:MAG TPA: NAD(P)H-binding protein [Chitinophagaceae bacterium]|nr:NAD(P)H-binding protein [Chitinophagaceae bacterium]
MAFLLLKLFKQSRDIMQILVIGASGRVGHKLAEKLLADGHQVVGTTRKEEKLFDSSDYTQIKLDLTASLKEIEAGIPEGTDAIYFVSGSRGADVLKVDLHGAVKTMQAAENKGINRYIMLSALYSLEPEKWTTIIDYFTGKYFADHWLVNNTDLDYTILQPGALTETDGSGKITTDFDEKGKVSIENVAESLKEVLGKSNTYGKLIPMIDGDTPIVEAINQV